MGVEMFMYLPLSSDCDLDNPPTIESDAANIAKAVREFEPQEEEEEQDRWRRNDPGLQAVEGAHKDRPGWMPVLAWSHGVSSNASFGRGSSQGNMQDLSITKWSDSNSPLMTVMVMSGEVLPHGLLRVCYGPKDDKMRIIEMHIKQVNVTSLSTGGSGGEDRLTENISVCFGVFFVRHCDLNIQTGEIVMDVRGGWDLEKKKGDRQGIFNPTPLRHLCLSVVSEHIDLYDEESFAKLNKDLQDQIGVSHMMESRRIPLKGRRLLVTDEEVVTNGDKPNHYREVFLKAQTVEALHSAISSVFNQKVDKVYQVLNSDLLLVENDRQVVSLSTNSCLSFTKA